MLLRAVRRFTYRRELAGLWEAERYVACLRVYAPEHYGARLCAAICAFVLHKDGTTAMAEIAACKRIEDGGWRYSEAFLLAYEGDLEGAYRAYSAAFHAPLGDITVPIQCEEFIHGVLEAEPERYWLYYSLGLINHRAKRDLAAAVMDFNKFVTMADSARFKKQIAAARKWVSEIQVEALSSNP